MKVAATIDSLASLLLVAGIILRPLIATEIPSAERRSGYTFMAPDTKAMQDDDTTNPGMLGVLDGESACGIARQARRANPAPIATVMRAAA